MRFHEGSPPTGYSGETLPYGWLNPSDGVVAFGVPYHIVTEGHATMLLDVALSVIGGEVISSKMGRGSFVFLMRGSRFGSLQFGLTSNPSTSVCPAMQTIPSRIWMRGVGRSAQLQEETVLMLFRGLEGRVRE